MSKYYCVMGGQWYTDGGKALEFTPCRQPAALVCCRSSGRVSALSSYTSISLFRPMGQVSHLCVQMIYHACIRPR